MKKRNSVVFALCQTHFWRRNLKYTRFSDNFFGHPESDKWTGLLASEGRMAGWGASLPVACRRPLRKLSKSGHRRSCAETQTSSLGPVHAVCLPTVTTDCEGEDFVDKAECTPVLSQKLFTQKLNWVSTGRSWSGPWQEAGRTLKLPNMKNISWKAYKNQRYIENIKVSKIRQDQG